jgi:DNA-binding MarR family transcriptional regulator
MPMQVDDTGSDPKPEPAAPRGASGGACLAAAELPFVDNYLPALLAQASELISGEFHLVVRAHGLSVPEWRVLATLSGGHALTTGKLAQVSLTKGPTATRMLDRMEGRGQVERLPHAADRRVTRVRITPEGQRTVSALIDLARAHEQRVLEPFGLRQAEALKATLRGMIDARRPKG